MCRLQIYDHLVLVTLYPFCCFFFVLMFFRSENMFILECSGRMRSTSRSSLDPGPPLVFESKSGPIEKGDGL